MDEEIMKTFEELKAMIAFNAEQSNTRMGSVNEMIHGVITIVTNAVEKQKVVEEALVKSQALSATLANTNAELIEQIKDIRKRCSDIQKENRTLNELLRSHHKGSMVSIENK